MAEETKNLKWKGKATAELKTTKAQQVWPLFEDFCNLHKWLPTVDTCSHVEGVHGEPGLVRYCTFIADSSSTDQAPAKWCYETLLSMDAVRRCLSYNMTDNTLGLSSYVAETKVFEVNDGCKIEWSFTLDPLEGVTLEQFSASIESLLKGMAERMENEFKVVAAK